MPRSAKPPLSLINCYSKSRYAIVTPNAPGINIARSIRNEDERLRLHEIAHEAFDDAPKDCGLILRSACEGAKRRRHIRQHSRNAARRSCGSE